MSQPRVRACIVSYRSGASAVRAARSCLASGAEVVLVDNAPGDGTAELVRRELPEVEIREPGENLGFAAGSDLAAEGAATELLLFLNPDAELDPGSLATLAARMDAAPGTGIVGPAVRFRDGRPQPTIRGDPTPAALLYEYTVLRHLRIGRAAYVRYRTPAEPRSGTGVVEVLMGCALLVRRDLFEELGGFDRRYFMYFEEADLCRRVRDAGRTVEFVPEATVVHAGGESAAQAPGKLESWKRVSAQRYLRRFCSGPRYAAFRAAFLPTYVLGTVVDLLRDLLHAGAYLLFRREKVRRAAGRALVSLRLLTVDLPRVVRA
jgi:N-acetylglucosaminyl-diphospho-decaprenol L-rhamnosyltransferase